MILFKWDPDRSFPPGVKNKLNEDGKFELLTEAYLREMEDKISLCVSARDYIEPQLPHEEHMVGNVDWSTCSIQI